MGSNPVTSTIDQIYGFTVVSTKRAATFEPTNSFMSSHTLGQVQIPVTLHQRSDLRVHRCLNLRAATFEPTNSFMSSHTLGQVQIPVTAPPQTQIYGFTDVSTCRAATFEPTNSFMSSHTLGQVQIPVFFCAHLRLARTSTIDLIYGFTGDSSKRHAEAFAPANPGVSWNVVTPWHPYLIRFLRAAYRSH